MALYPGAARVRQVSNLGGADAYWEVRAKVGGDFPALSTPTGQTADHPAGTAVTVTVEWTRIQNGVNAPPSNPDIFLTLHIDTQTGTIYNNSIIANASTSGFTTRTIHLRENPDVVASAIRAGTLRLRVRMRNTSTTGSYDVTSDGGLYGSPNTPQTGFTAFADQGYLRATTNATTTLGTAVDGTPSAGPFGYPDTVYARTVLGAASYTTRQVSIKLGTRAAVLSNSVQSDTFITTLGTPDDSWPAAAESLTTATTFPNATLTSLPWTTPDSGLGLVEDTETVDPRLTAVPLFQIDDNTFATPPLSKNVSTYRRLTTQTGFLAARYVNVRGEGINGLTVTRTLTPQKPGTTLTSSGVVTSTQGGQAGWTPLFPWDSQLPAGRWVKRHDITAPAAIDSDSHLIATEVDHFLVAVDPNLTPVGILGGLSRGRHVVPGDTILIGAQLQNTAPDQTQQMLYLDTDASGPLCFALIYRPNATGTGADFLDLDYTWKPTLVNSIRVPVARHRIPPIPGTDSQFFRLIIPGSTTTAWDMSDIEVVVRMVREGASYITTLGREFTSALNAHDKYVFDGAGFVGFPNK